MPGVGIGTEIHPWREKTQLDAPDGISQVISAACYKPPFDVLTFACSQPGYPSLFCWCYKHLPWYFAIYLLLLSTCYFLFVFFLFVLATWLRNSLIWNRKGSCQWASCGVYTQMQIVMCKVNGLSVGHVGNSRDSTQSMSYNVKSRNKPTAYVKWALFSMDIPRSQSTVVCAGQKEGIPNVPLNFSHSAASAHAAQL